HDARAGCWSRGISSRNSSAHERALTRRSRGSTSTSPAPVTMAPQHTGTTEKELRASPSGHCSRSPNSRPARSKVEEALQRNQTVARCTPACDTKPHHQSAKGEAQCRSRILTSSYSAAEVADTQRRSEAVSSDSPSH